MNTGDRRPKSWVDNTELNYQPRHLAGRLLKEDRKQIASQYFEPVSSVASLSDSSNAIPMPAMWYDSVEISDFEHQITAQTDATSDASDVVRNLSEFPSDDVDVQSVPRECRTVNPVKLEEENVDSHVLNCFNSFTNDWSFYTRKYAEYGSGTLAYNEEKSAEDIKSLPKQVYEGEAQDNTSEDSISLTPDNESIEVDAEGSLSSSNQGLKNSQSDPRLESVLESTSQDEVDATNREKRNNNRLPSLFALYHPPSKSNGTIQQSAVGGIGDDSDFPIEKRHIPPVPEEYVGVRLLVKCLSLELEVEMEPIFACIALYDTKHKKRVSENFYFDLNSEAMNKMIKTDVIHPSIPTLARSAIFSLTNPSKDIFIVIRLEKVLQQGEIVNCAEPYMKDATEKVREKSKQSAKWFCEHLGKYRMPFAWTAIHLMNIVDSATNLKPMQEATSSAFSTPEESKSSSTLDSNMQRRSLKNTLSGQQDLSESEQQMLTTFKPVTLTVSSFFKQESDKLKDEDLFKFLLDLKRPSNMLKKLKCIPGRLKLDVSPRPANFQYCITPDLHRLKPYPDQRGRPSREIKDFPPKEVYVPNMTYCNLMYVYPLNVNFTNKPGHVRNIAVKVQLLCGEEANSVLPAIFGKSNCADFNTEAYSSVTYHSKNPDYYEEIKIKLPAKITEKHHLLFTFYHISCQKKQDLTPIETIVGYTWMPLLQNGHLHVGDLALPVSMDKLPPNYTLLSVESNIPGVKWVDGRKLVFTVSVKCISTVHTMDRHLDNYFTVCNVIDKGAIGRTDDVELRLRKSMLAVTHDAKLEPLVHFLHVVLNKFIQLLVKPPVINGHVINLGTTCFESLASLTVRLHHSLEFDVNEHGHSNLLNSYVSYVFNPSALHESETESGDGLSVLGGSHYATMTRPVQRTRPAMTTATFNLSSSNPDLTTPPTTPEEPNVKSPLDDDPSKFLRFSSSRASLMEQPAVNKNVEGTGVRSITRKVFHEELALLWVVSTGYVRETSFKHSWFFFEMMTKSMAQHLKLTGSFEMSRSARFPARFVDDLTRLIHMVTNEIINRYNKDYDFAERLNLSLAFFFNNLLSIMDRGFVFSMLQSYAQKIGSKIFTLQSPASLLNLRLTLLRVVASHEHYITLNLPFANRPSPSSPTPSVTSTTSSIISSGTTHITSQYELSDSFIQRHYLAGIILSDIQMTIDMTETASVTGSQLYAVTTLRNLMISHDMDSRLKDDPIAKEKVAALYMPLMLIAIKALPYLHQFGFEDSSETGVISQAVANAIASASPLVLSRTASQNVSFNAGMLSAECTRNLLLCVSWLLKNVSKQTIGHLLSGLPTVQTNILLELLYISVSCFEYKVKKSFNLVRTDSSRSSVSRKKDKMTRLEDSILGAASARREMLMRRRNEKGSSSSMPRDFERGLRWRKDRTEWKQDKELSDKGGDDNAVVNGNFAAESTLIVLDLLDLIMETASEMGTVPVILSSCLRTLLHCLGTKQSTSVYNHIFATQRSIVAKFPELVFEEEVEQCADLCLRLLQRCSSNITSIRSQAAASLYLLMRHNFSVGNSFARVKMQITMSLSSLVGMTASENFDEEYLRRSLKTVLTYAENDADLKSTSFPEQVQDMISNFHMILSDTVKMKEHKEDPEMLIDLMYRIAKGYQNSPDLRMTWLQNMAQQHSERKNHAESGMCILHSAALVAEYLGMIEETSYLPIGCVSFQHITNNILEESAVSDDVVSPLEDGVCTEKYFSMSGLVGLLEQAAYAFNLAGLYEVTNKIYKLLIPVYEKFHEYKKLSALHTKLSDCFTKISSHEGKRMFGTYFRIGFYGSLFGDLNTEEFIYKEPSITKLPEISYRLETFYGHCFGETNVEVLKDSNQVDISKLDPNKAYIQITYVEPYFLEWEESRRTTYFDRNYNIKNFVYATPYTLDGKAHGSMKDQYKRKVFLQVSENFPYVRTRLSVVKKWDTVLTPLETACEDVQRKTSQLLLAAEQLETDVRMLQVNLQGSLLTTVNQGPMEVAQTFLNSVPEDPKMWIPYNRLRLAFKKFLYACSVALKKNKLLIGPDQNEYQRELQRNYNRMTEQLRPMIENRRVMQLIRGASPDTLGI